MVRFRGVGGPAKHSYARRSDHVSWLQNRRESVFAMRAAEAGPTRLSSSTSSTSTACAHPALFQSCVAYLSCRFIMHLNHRFVPVEQKELVCQMNNKVKDPSYSVGFVRGDSTCMRVYHTSRSQVPQESNPQFCTIVQPAGIVERDRAMTWTGACPHLRSPPAGQARKRKALCSRSHHSTLTPTKLPHQPSGAPSTLSPAEEAAIATLREIMGGECVCARGRTDDAQQSLRASVCMHVCIDWYKLFHYYCRHPLVDMARPVRMLLLTRPLCGTTPGRAPPRSPCCARESRPSARPSRARARHPRRQTQQMLRARGGTRMHSCSARNP
jgi:hypothetical protein